MKLCGAKIWAHFFPDPSRAGGSNFELYVYQGVCKHPHTGEDMYRFTTRKKQPGGVSEIIYSALTIERMKNFRPFCIDTKELK